MCLFKVNIDDNQESVTVPKGVRMLVRRCCKAVLHEEKKESFEDVNIVFTENRKLSELNGQSESKELFVRPSHDTASELGEHLGEVHISLEKALQRSLAFNNSFEAEVVFLTAHGMFMLLGYQNLDTFGKDELRDKEKRIIKSLGISYQTHF